ncbi:hypothetical protein L1887_03765 [Cichorium endivia]|nr:hypothetical protein L1887_03765 [Cichorium endivia]
MVSSFQWSFSENDYFLPRIHEALELQILAEEECAALPESFVVLQPPFIGAFTNIRLCNHHIPPSSENYTTVASKVEIFPGSGFHVAYEEINKSGG